MNKHVAFTSNFPAGHAYWLNITMAATGLMLTDQYFLSTAFSPDYLHTFNLNQYVFISESLQEAELKSSDIVLTNSEIAVVFSSIIRIVKIILSDDSEKLNMILAKRLQLGNEWQKNYLAYAQFLFLSSKGVYEEYPECLEFIEGYTK